MKRSIVLCSLIVVTASAWSSFSFAAPQRNPAHQLASEEDNAKGNTVSPADKAASDRLMQAGLSYLQRANSDLQAGNREDALESLRTAYNTMLAAVPHYYGHRHQSLIFTKRAGLVIARNKPNALQRAVRPVGKAMTEAQSALKVW